MFDSVIFAIKSVLRKKFRSLLTIIGISIGVGSVVLIGNISKCGSEAISNELDSLGLGSLSISANLKTGSKFYLDETALDIIKNTDQVVDASPVIVNKVEAFNNRKSTDALLWGINSHSHNIVSLKPLYGRCLNKNDISMEKNVCMVDQSFSKSFFGIENAVGKNLTITIDNVTDNYEVIGVIQTGNGLLANLVGDYIPNFVYMPYTTLQNCTGKNFFDQIAVKIKDTNAMSKVSNDILRRLNLNVGEKDAYVANNLVKQRQGLTNILNIITLILSIIGAISLLVASLSIMTVMLVSVNERTREIGIKKSFGARKVTIMFEFLMEALVLTFIGSFVGCTSGTFISFVGSAIIGIKINLNLNIMLVATAISMLSGACFGIYPAWKAANLNPVDALS